MNYLSGLIAIIVKSSQISLIYVLLINYANDNE